MDEILVKEEVEGDIPDGMLKEDIPQSGFNTPNKVYLSSPTPTVGFLKLFQSMDWMKYL